MLEADVQESERLNKCLSLFGERCPNGNLDLGSARACLKHYLSKDSGFVPAAGRPKFSVLRPHAEQLHTELMSGWALMHEVDTEDRFQPVGGPRAGCPTLATANAAQREIDPDLFPPVTAGKVWAASVNSKYRSQAKAQQLTGSCASSVKAGLRAVAFVMDGKAPQDAPVVFLVTDQFRTLLHFVALRRLSSGRYELKQPWAFLKSHKVFERFNPMVRQQITICIFEFLLHVRVAAWQIFISFSIPVYSGY